MKRKLIAAVSLLLAFAALAGSCRKKKNANLFFTDLDDFTVLVEGRHKEGDEWICYEGKVLEIPAKTKDDKMVTEIGAFAFWQLTNLKKVVVPYSIDTIGASAFEGCTSLTEVTLASAVEGIGIEAFRGCTSLKSVSMYPSVWAIGVDAFTGCTSLTEITFYGTMKQWNDIQRVKRKDGQIVSAWIETDKQITIHCTDGDFVEWAN